MRTRLALLILVAALAIVGRASRVARANAFYRSPQQNTVEQFYVDLQAGAYADAYSFFSPAYAARVPFANWVAGYATTEDFDWSTWATDDPAVIGVHLSADDAVQGHQEFEGTWSLVPSALSPSGWLIDDGSFAASGPFPSPLSGDDAFAPFADSWWRHGFGMRVDPGGHASLTFRIYSWCSVDPTPPCDTRVGDYIYGGGHGGITFSSVVGNTAYGRYDDGGPVMLTLMPYDMATLVDPGSGRSLVLCGSNFWSLAPPDLIASGPCGA